ncbi:hypothetical protein [Nevskia ramosa]|uniref:DNA polymerase III subunit beta family protein n=1 Tax=Nevskia ramosa TaxID=64002 RepID=UPI003D12FBCD
MNIVIPSKVIKAALICVARQDVRYYLNGILIEPAADLSAVYIVATDGHRMVVIRVEQAADAIPADMQPMILSTRGMMAASKNDTVVLTGIDAQSKCMLTRSLKAATLGRKRYARPEDDWHLCSVIEGKFPNWRNVLSQSVNAPEMDAPGAQHEYLNGLQQIYRLLAGELHQSSLASSALFQVVQRGDNAMTLAIPTDEGIEAVAIVMPMRPSGLAGAACPEWAKAAKPIEIKPEPKPAAKPAATAKPARAVRQPAAKKPAKKAA